MLSLVTIDSLKEARNKAIALGREILDRATREKRRMLSEEEESWDRAITEAKNCDRMIEVQIRSEEVDSLCDRMSNGETRGIRPDLEAATKSGKPGEDRAQGQLQWEAFGEWCRGGASRVAEFRSRHPECRNLQLESDTAGGYLVPHEQFISEIIKTVDNAVWVRQRVRVIPVSDGQQITAPTRTARLSDAAWTGEITAPTTDTQLAYGKRIIRPYHLKKLIRVSNDLLNAPGIDAGREVLEEIAYVMAITKETAYMTGTGVAQPLGMYIANASGISTARDMSTDNSTTAIAADNLIRMQWTLKEPYQAEAAWNWHRDSMNNISRLKGGDGHYLLRLGNDLVEGRNLTLLGKPVLLSEYTPNTFTTGGYLGLYANFRRLYWIAEVRSLRIQRLVELYAATGETGFIVELKEGGAPVQEEACVRCKLA